MARMNRNRSRLSNLKETRIRKNLFLSLAGIAIVIFIVIKFGLPFLVNLTLFLSGSRSSEVSTQNNSIQFISPPIINPMSSATNSASVTISGNSSPNQTVNLYINNSLMDKVKTKSDGSFTFTESLTPGENIIKVNATVDNKTSDFSDTQTVIFKNALPSLTIDSPSDGQVFSKDQNLIQVKGKTDSDVKLTINDLWVIVDENNNFSYSLTLKNGENPIKVTATDQAGNKKEVDLKVNYNP